MKSVSKFILIFVSTIAFSSQLAGQASLRDSSINMGIAGFNYSYFIPLSDMKDRFGHSAMLGINGGFKHSSNFFVDADLGFLFGSEVKENNILDGLKTNKGYLINAQGLMEPVALEERGIQFHISLGKMFPWLGPNPNSGFFISAGAGFIQHRILFGYASKNLVEVPMIEGNYAYGYDRLTNGMTLNQSIGYKYFSNRNLGNFFISFDVIEGFTQSRRNWNFDEFRQDNSKRRDILAGVRVGMNIPIYARVPDDFYTH